MGRFEESAKRSGEKIDQKYADEIKGIQLPSEEKLCKLFPTETDQKYLAELLRVVRKATNDMEILERLKDTSSHFGLTAVKLIKAFILKT